MEWTEGDLVWFDPNIGHPLPGEIQEVHRAAQVIIVQAVINGKVSSTLLVAFYFERFFSSLKEVIKFFFLQKKSLSFIFSKEVIDFFSQKKLLSFF